MWSSVLIGCMLLHVTGGQSTAPPYVVVVPAVLIHPSSEIICVYLSESSDYHLEINLKTHLQSDMLLMKRTRIQGSFECTSFQVPPPFLGSEEVATIEVSLDDGKRKMIVESKQVVLQASQKGTFVQTDKLIYREGETVKIRIVTFDKFFMPINDKYTNVLIVDPRGNRIVQWLNVAPQQGILDLSHPVCSEPLCGIYTIKVNGSQAEQTFEIQEFVLPKFEVEVKLPLAVTSHDEIIPIAVCGRYPYGKPVKGTVQAKLCRKAVDMYSEDICMTYNEETGSDGCFDAHADAYHFKLSSKKYSQKLQVEALLTEEGTAVSIESSGSCSISSFLARVTFEDVEPNYKPGMLYRGTMRLAGTDGTPLPKKTLVISVNGQQTGEVYTTSQNGKVSFSLNTASWKGSFVTLKAQCNQDQEGSYKEAQQSVKRFWADGKSYLSIRPLSGPLMCGRDRVATVDFNLDPSDMEEKTRNLQFNYLVIAKGGIVHHGVKREKVSRTAFSGSFTIPLHINAALAPYATVLVYTSLLNMRLAADSAKFAIETCFNNKVSLEFSEAEALPGSEVNLRLQAAPGSLCSIRAVDKSVLLQKPEDELTSSRVYKLLSFLSPGGYPPEVDETERPCKPRTQARTLLAESPWESKADFKWWRRPRGKRSLRPFPLLTEQPDAFSLFKDAGLKIWTNLNAKQPQECSDNGFAVGRALMDFVGAESFEAGMLPRGLSLRRPMTRKFRLEPEPESEPEPEPETEPEPEQSMRTLFPETWLWDLQSTGPTGKKEISVPAPHTITEWKANSFCMSDIGLGISPVITLKTFKPFFADLTMPFSVVRGERFPLKATVFNYMKECIAVQMTLAESQDFTVERCEKCSYSSCLCANEVKTFTWHITPSSLGEVNIIAIAEAIDSTKICGSFKSRASKTTGSKDMLRKVLLVQAEGVLVEKSHSALMCNVASETFSLDVPPHVLQDSVRAHVYVTGDLMGTAINNLYKLLALPFGSGEQNMVKFAPIIHGLNYLQKTNQLTRNMKDQGLGILKTGYQRQLNFKRSDGSYSSFGNQDPSGNPWLTALVAKSFQHAKEYIYIEEKHIQDAVNWLKKSQMPNGNFRNEGKLMNNALKAGEDDDVCLTAYVTITLLELETPKNDSVLRRAMQFLDSIDIASCSLYKKALMTIVYTVAGDKQKRKELLQELDKYAIKSDGEMYWTETPHEIKKESFWPQPNPADVELTAIVLTAIVSDKYMTRSDWKTALSIEKWLIKQQNPYGGFSTTQDTMVALQAIANHAERTYSPGGKLNVFVTSSGGFQHKFTVEGSTRLLLQKTALPEIPGQYTVGLSGRGCVVVLTTMRYNVPLTKNTASFSLEVWTSPKECTAASGKQFTLKIRVCYTGTRTSTNMVVLEVKMVSGFVPDSKTVKALQQLALVKKTEISAFGFVIVYIEEMTHTPQEISFVVEQELPITNPKPAMVRVYDYYQSVEEGLVEYSAPCH